jgi:hypothetical protein
MKRLALVALFALGCESEPGPFDIGVPGEDAGFLLEAGDGGASELGGARTVTWAAAPLTVASGAGLSLAPSNAAISVRAPDGRLHLVWSLAGTIYLGTRPPAGAWTARPLPHLGGGMASDATLALEGSALVVAWTETTATGDTVIATSRSLDDGASWALPSQLSVSGTQSAGASAASVGTATVVAWTEGLLGHIVAVRVPSGAAARLDSGVARSKDVSLVARGSTVAAVWDNDAVAPRKVYAALSGDGGRSFSGGQPLGTIQPGRSLEAGERASVCLDGAARPWVAYQDGGHVWAARGIDAAGGFVALGDLGFGLAARIACDASGAVAVAWEYTTGDPANDALKSVGLALSLDAFGTVVKPHAAPGTAFALGRLLAHAAIDGGGGALDLFWLDESGAQPLVQHLGAALR